MRLTRIFTVTSAMLLLGTMAAPSALAETPLPQTATLTLQFSQVSPGQSMHWQVNCKPGAIAAGVHWDAELESWGETNAGGQAAGDVKFDGTSWSFGGANQLTVYAECQWGTFPKRRQASKPVQLTLRNGSTTVKRATVWNPIYEEVSPTALVSRSKIKVGKKLTIDQSVYGKKQKMQALAIELTNKNGTINLATVKPNKKGVLKTSIKITKRVKPGTYQLRVIAPKDWIYYQVLKVKKK